MVDTIIETQDLWKVYGDEVRTEALKGVSIEIKAGSYVCIAGPSGHGKTTLLHIIGCLDKPTSGEVNIKGTNVTQLSDNDLADIRSKNIGFVFQFFNLVPNLTSLENVELSLMFAGVKESKQREVAKELLAALGLEDKYNALANELSGGQQQRVAIARALANDPDILLMDEPTGNLDSLSQDEVLNHIEMVHQKGKTIVLVTHNEEIVKRAEKVIRIQNGIIK
jgi:putative ABC transport system ATP-binding protein